MAIRLSFSKTYTWEKFVEFDLTSGGNIYFKTNKDHTIATNTIMKRRLRFVNNEIAYV